ncbi:MAG TPA: DNA repair protein RecO [Bacilli bacterium]|nr:MAG: DNA repair protein RecO [Tenericutes bacterium ADurb.BinA124]HNZ50634.1 DNA repair protein RecO [Bacilli bacterium]HPX84670.1 DNA repair protein RecO [Bacilli bacterium]HQC74520.1 DNA repair protein RecO [Bacilli bacterium]
MSLIEGLIIKTQNYQENSKIVWILTAFDYTSYLMRGSANPKSHNYAYSNELTKIRFQTSDRLQKGFPILTSGEVVQNFSATKTNIDKMRMVIVILDMINQLANHIDDKQTLFSFCNQILDLINNSFHPLYLQIFRLKLLYLLGVGPIFSKCVNCGTSIKQGTFDLNNGGMVCVHCQNQTLTFFDPDVIEVIKFLYLTKLVFLSPPVLNQIPNYLLEISQFLDHYYEHFLGFNSRAEAILKKL